jgi:membrane protease YdiL (CAAX protease family)
MNTESKGVIWFLILAFGIAWLFWEIPLRLGLTLSDPMFQIFLLPGSFAPAIAAVIVRKWITNEGFEDAGFKLHFKKRWSIYLIAWLLPFVVIGGMILVNTLLNVTEPVLDTQEAIMKTLPDGQEIPENAPPMTWWLVVAQGLVMSIIAIPLLWGEEFGWRGYLQLRLFGDQPVKAAVVTGFIWGVWHYPINLRGYNFPDHEYLGLIVFPVSTVFISIILGWFRYRSGSIWAASLGHSATNAIGGSLAALLFAAGPMIYTNYLGILAWIPLGIVAGWIVLTGRLPREIDPGVYKNPAEIYLKIAEYYGEIHQ